MTQLIGNALPDFTLRANDTTLLRIGIRLRAMRNAAASRRPVSYSTAWWPGSGFMGDASTDCGAQEAGFFAWAAYYAPSGVNSRLGYMGITRDVNNSPLGGCTVKLFLTSDDSKVTPDITSDALSGEYVISTPYYAAHWIKVKKSGSPDVQGVSADSIFPNV